MERMVRPASAVRGTVTVPGDKSISHRAFLIGALARGATVITNPSPGKDVGSTRRCLEQLGIRFESDGNAVRVHGQGPAGWKRPSADLDAGNSGTTIRLLSGILAGLPFATSITGDGSLRRRPMERVVAPLRLMGADISTAPGGVAPLSIRGRRLAGMEYRLPVASAQVKSCVLLAGLLADGTTAVTEPARSRDHTERMLPQFGIPIEVNGLTVRLRGPAEPKACAVDVPGDLSSAAFFMAAAAMVPGSDLRLRNIGINPTRVGLLDVLRRMGGDVRLENSVERCGEPRADLRVRTAALRGTLIAGDVIPQIIDEIPVLAVLASQAAGRTVVRDAKELRVKETDRIAAVAGNLRAMGVPVDVLEDGFVIEGPHRLRGAAIDSREDHRIAMAFSIAGLVADAETRIYDAGCVDISYPGFYDTLAEVVRHA